MTDNSETTSPPIIPADSGGGGLSELVAEHAQQFPQPNPESVEAEEAKLAQELDPEVYVIKDGKPVRNKDGSLKKKTGPKKPEATAPDEFLKLGAIAARVTFSTCQSIFGSDWQPTEEEKAELTDAFGVYLRSKGMNDLPPGFALAFALFNYAATKPQTQMAVVGAMGWVKQKFNRRKNGTNRIAAGGGGEFNPASTVSIAGTGQH